MILLLNIPQFFLGLGFSSIIAVLCPIILFLGLNLSAKNVMVYLFFAIFILLSFIFFKDVVSNIPEIIRMFLFYWCLFILIPKLKISMKSLYIQITLILIYGFMYTFLSDDHGSHYRNIGFFREFDYVINSAYDFGFNSPSKAAIFFTFSIYLLFSSCQSSGFRNLLIVISSICVFMTLNRLSIIVVSYLFLINFSPIRKLYLLPIIIFILGIVLLKGQALFPFGERLYRVIGVLEIESSLKENVLYYKYFFENNLNNYLTSFSDFSLTIFVFAFGVYLGILLFIMDALLKLGAVRAFGYSSSLTILFILYVTKNWSVGLDLIVFYVIYCIKLEVIDGKGYLYNFTKR